MSEHFTTTELTDSSTATRLGIDNTAPADVLLHLETLASGLENVRMELGYPMHIDSGYRCPALNAAIGGAHDSAHLSGYAADFKCDDFGTPLDIVKAIVASGLKFDQCIQEGTWVHISFDPAMRQETLTAHFAAGQKTTYTQGV